MPKTEIPAPITKERIVASASALLRKHGASKWTLSDVARALGVSHAALYRYFDGKAALEAAIVEGWIVESLERIAKAEAEEADPINRIERILVEMHTHKKDKILADPEVYRLYLSVLQDNPPTLQAYAARVRHAIKTAFIGHFGEKDDRIAEAALVLENSIFRYLHPVHTMEALGEDTDVQLRTIIRAIFRAYPAN